jgi:hypothetical protein
MRRGLQYLVDPEPNRGDKEKIRAFFQDQCAYCGESIPRGSGDIDHLIPVATGGANALANRVLSCKSCNSKEKRGGFWREFLAVKSLPNYQQRSSHIETWVKMNGGQTELDPKVRELLDKESEKVTREYRLACFRIRKAMPRNDMES